MKQLATGFGRKITVIILCLLLSFALFPQGVNAEELKPAEFSKKSIAAIAPDTCVVSWKSSSKSTIWIHFEHGDVSSTRDLGNEGTFVINNVDMGDTVTVTLYTDSKHKKVTLKCNPSDKYKPNKISKASATFKAGSAHDMEYYGRSIRVYDKRGAWLGQGYDYLLKCNSKNGIRSPGTYSMKISFTGKYKVYKNVTTNLTVLPPRAKVSLSSKSHCVQGSTYFKFDVMADKYWDTAKATISTSKNFTNAKSKTHKATGKNVRFSFSNLKKNTKYYVRITTTRKVNGKTYTSKYKKFTICTVKSFPKYSPTHKYTKLTINKMKKNKSFKICFPGYRASYKITDFYNEFKDDFMQYSDRYSRTIKRGNKCMYAVFKLNKSQVKRNVKLAKAVSSIVSVAKKKSGTRAKCLYINDKICRICTYDYDTLNGTSKKSSLAYIPYGCLVRGKAVCSGYAKAFHLIAVQCGIKDKYAHGPDHVWNKIKVGGNWRHLDVTWNDTTRSHRYFLSTSH